jgi:isocitrate/isopropylmalate dehydrogenase
VHGSAPDIVGKGVANPLGTIGSLAMLLSHIGEPAAAAAVEAAVARVVRDGQVTPDLGGALSTVRAGEAVRRALEEAT